MPKLRCNFHEEVVVIGIAFFKRLRPTYCGLCGPNEDIGGFNEATVFFTMVSFPVIEGIVCSQ